MKLSVAEWQQKHGVRMVGDGVNAANGITYGDRKTQGDGWKSLPPDMTATLIAPDGPAGIAYLACHNFHVIMRYNPSSLYGLAIAELARRLA
ncbi:hypothetical protein CLOM_g13601 [Closterium sp. NIES-68]|nr:hypothetical protein CLOM_g13601 [Closterium sp. NIES-68]